jgi:diguanylate cyclase (GGDEF)-like protein/PAS domain S-box-containing protein
MRKEYARMSKWALHCPDNFLQQQYMMKAEWARIVRKADVAEAYYNLAIQTSGKGSFIRYKALSNELAAKFYYSRDRNEIAAYYFRQASYYYSVWGAKGKIDQLERDYGELQGLVNRATVVPDQISAPSSEDIDVHSILMASEAISKEIGLDRLLETLMKIVIVNAGAQRGCIVMKSSSSILVEGEYQQDEDLITVKMQDSSLYDHYPRSIIAAAADSQDTIIYDDAGSEASFVEDEYMEMYKPKSLLCIPLMNQSKVTAIIYLENNLVTGAFTKERIRMINLLSREMVNSLENASLYTNLERLVAERTEELAYKNEQLNKYIDIVDKNVIIIQTDSQGVITAVSEEFCKSSGYQQEELLGQPHRFVEPSRDLDHPDHEFVDFEIGSASVMVWKGELVQLTKDSSTLWLDMAVESVWDQGLITGYTWIGHNITDKKRIEQNSITDDLTGLYNRRYFKDVIWREVKRAARNEDYLTFILLDIDNYKKYNDTYGHYEGDLVLHRIGLTINEQLRRATDYAFRLGGEEFGVVYSGADAEHSYGFAEKIRRSIEALNIPHEENDTSSCVTVSVGLAVVAVKDNQMNEEMIYKLADEALYRSKARGKNCVTMNVL